MSSSLVVIWVFLGIGVLGEHVRQKPGFLLWLLPGLVLVYIMYMLYFYGVMP